MVLVRDRCEKVGMMLHVPAGQTPELSGREGDGARGGTLYSDRSTVLSLELQLLGVG